MVLALIATVLMLFAMGFFFLGTLPLLFRLKYDVPADARFVRGLFNVYFLAVVVTATLAAVSYAFAGEPGFLRAVLDGGGAAAAGEGAGPDAEEAPRFSRSRRHQLPARLLSAEACAGMEAARRRHLRVGLGGAQREGSRHGPALRSQHA